MTSLRLRDGIAKYVDLAMLLAYAGDSDPFEAPTHVIVLGDPSCREEFLSIAFYRDTMWLSSATALHVLLARPIVMAVTGLSPSPRSAGRLQVVDDVLWSFGTDEVLRFDGKVWVRFVWPGGRLKAGDKGHGPDEGMALKETLI